MWHNIAIINAIKIININKHIVLIQLKFIYIFGGWWDMY